MKKLILVTTLFLSLGALASAQDKTTENRETLQIGARIGGTYSNVYNAKGEKFEADPKFGYTVGGFIMIPIGKYLGVQPEIGLTQKGFKGSGTLLGSSYSFNRTTTFLEIPLLLAIKPSKFITILAGPQYSYLLKQKDKFTSSENSVVQEHEFEQDNIRKNIFGIAAGVDINVKHLVIGGRVGWDLQNNKGDGTSSTPKYKNLSAQLTVGFKIYN